MDCCFLNLSFPPGVVKGWLRAGLALIVLILSDNLHAQNFDFTGGLGGNNSQLWGTAFGGNWAGGTAPTNNAGATVNITNFPSAAFGTNVIQLRDSVTIGILNATAPGFINRQSGAQQFAFDNNGAIAQVNSSGTGNLDLFLPVILNDDIQLNAAGDSIIRIRSGLSGTGGVEVNDTSSGDVYFRSGTFSYTGETRITDGTLRFHRDITSIASPSIVANGIWDLTETGVTNLGYTLQPSQTLSGTGLVSMPTTLTRINALRTAGATLRPGDNSIGTLTFGGAGLDLTGGNFHFDLSDTTSDLINANRLYLSGTPGTVVVDDSGRCNIGTVPLFDYSGALTGNVGDLGLVLPTGWTATLVHNTADGSIDLVITEIIKPPSGGGGGSTGGGGGGSTGGGGGTTVIPTIIEVTDTAAIDQLIDSAIPMNLAVGQVAANIHNVAGRSLNQRIYRLRMRHTPFEREHRMRRGHEVSASRYHRAERDMNITNTINLNGQTTAATTGVTSSAAHSRSTDVNDANPFVPSVTQPANHSADPDVIAYGNNWEVFAAADFGQYDLDALGGSPGLDSHTYAATAGIEYVLNENCAVGVGWSHIWNDNTLRNGLGGVDIEGDAYMTYASYFNNNFWGDIFYSYGDYQADITRNTGLGSTVTASPDIESHQTTLNLGYNIPVENRFVHGPTFRADYSWGQLDGYTETGDIRASSMFREQDYESLITTLGWQLNWNHDTTWGAMSPTFRLGYGRENFNQETNVSGTLQQSPVAQINTATGAVVGRGASVSRSLSQVDPGEGWMEFGAGMGLDFNSNFGLFFDYQARFFQEHAQLHLGTVKASWRW